MAHFLHQAAITTEKTYCHTQYDDVYFCYDPAIEAKSIDTHSKDSLFHCIVILISLSLLRNTFLLSPYSMTSSFRM